MRRSLLAALLLRALVLLASAAGAVSLVLSLFFLAPGDAIDLLPNAEEVRPILAQRWGLDQSLPERFVAWFQGALRGDLGISLTLRPGAPVADLLWAPAFRSLSLFTMALLLALTWGGALATLTQGRAGTTRWAARLLSVAPIFLLAHLLINGLNAGAWWAMSEGIVDRPAWFALPDEPSTLRSLLAVFLLAVGSGTLADIHREIEGALRTLRQSAFIEAARARGEPLAPHLLRNLVVPVVTVAVARTPALLGGLVIVEEVLLIHGLGSLFWRAAELRDHPVALGASVVLGLVAVGVRFVGDALRVGVDPRLREVAT